MVNILGREFDWDDLIETFASNPTVAGITTGVNAARANLGEVGLGGLLNPFDDGLPSQATRNLFGGSGRTAETDNWRDRGPLAGHVTRWMDINSADGVPQPPRLEAPTPVVPSLVDAQIQAVDMLTGMETQYQEQLASLRSQYQLAETPEEKAQLQFMLENLEAQKTAGQEVVKRAYGEAIKGSRQTARQTRKQGNRAGEAAEKSYGRAARQARNLVEDGEESFEDIALGLGAGGVSGDAAAAVRDLARTGAQEGQFARGMGRAAANEIAFLGESMKGERSAQQGELERLALALGAQAQMDHSQQVAARIAQERQALAAAQQGLSNAFTQQAWNVQNTGASSANQQAILAAEAANQQQQQQFELDAQREALTFEQEMADYQARQEAKRQQEALDHFIRSQQSG